MSSLLLCFFFFFFNDTATTEIYTLSLHDALPILGFSNGANIAASMLLLRPDVLYAAVLRSEEHTSELQSLAYLVCRLLLEKKKKINLGIVFLIIIFFLPGGHWSLPVIARHWGITP